jgi:PAS domain S-box-containing protein
MRSAAGIGLRYGLGLVSLGLALGLANAFLYFHLPQPFTAFALCAIAITFWYGGIGPGILTALLAALIRTFVFQPGVDSLSRIVYDLVFVIFAVLMVQATRARNELEVRVAERTAALTRANQDLKIEIAERRSIEEKLRRSESYLAEAQRVSHTGSFGWTLSSGRIYWSEETFRIFELDPATEPTIQLILERTHPEDRQLVQQTIDIAAQQRSAFDFEHRLLTPDGSIKHVRVVGHPSNSDGAADVEFLGAVMDISHTKRAEESLRRSENYLAAAQSLAHMGSWVWEVPTRKVLYLSDEWYRMYGFDPRRGMVTWEERVERNHPEDRERWQATIDRAIQDKTGYDFEFRIVLPNGNVRHIHTVAHPVMNASGDLVQFVGSSADITERKAVEESLRRSEAYLAEGQRLTKMGSWSANITTRQHLHWSEEHSRLYGFDPKAKVPTFEEISQRIHPEDRKSVRAKFEEANRDGRDIEADYRVVLPDGTIKYMHSVGHPVLKSSGEVGEFFGITRDVTQRRLYDQEIERFRQTQADLAHISRVTTMGELTASLAHEVNQPIAAAMTDANTCLTWLTRDHPDVKKAREAASRVVRATTVAAEIISRIRSLFKKSVPESTAVDVNEVIQEMTILLRSEMMQHLISARTELPRRAVWVMGDRVQLQQVFMNLMLNSIDAMKTASGRRELAIKAEPADNQHILVSVSDTGIGLPPNHLDQLFDAFFTTKREGTGMGLRISRSIIEAHGGRLWAAANSPRGAVFNFTLPTAEDGQGQSSRDV